MTSKSYHQLCGLAYALDIVGERWTLLIIRELMPGPRRYTDLLDGLPGISTNLLSRRLKRLEEEGLIYQRVLPPPAASTVYELTPLGRELEETLLALGKWGSQFVPAAPNGDAVLRLGSYALTLKTFFEPQQARAMDETYEMRVDDEVLQVRIEDGEIDVRQGQPWQPGTILCADMPAYMALLRGEMDVRQALDAGLIRVEGEVESLQRFFDLCGVPPREA